MDWHRSCRNSTEFLCTCYPTSPNENLWLSHSRIVTTTGQSALAQYYKPTRVERIWPSPVFPQYLGLGKLEACCKHINRSWFLCLLLFKGQHSLWAKPWGGRGAAGSAPASEQSPQPAVCGAWLGLWLSALAKVGRAVWIPPLSQRCLLRLPTRPLFFCRDGTCVSPHLSLWGGGGKEEHRDLPHPTPKPGHLTLEETGLCLGATGVHSDLPPPGLAQVSPPR